MRRKTLILIMLLISLFVFAQSNNENKANTKNEGCLNTLINTYVDLTGGKNEVYLFHLYPQLFIDRYVNRIIFSEFIKRQKYITSDMQGANVNYVLYRLKFFNCMIKVFSDSEFGFKWDGVMFYDYEKKRLLLIRLTKDYPSEKKKVYLEGIDYETCSTIEYFDLNKGIYEFAESGSLMRLGEEIKIKDDKLEICVKVLKGTFPGIDRDYCCKESIPITDEIRAFLQYTERIYPEKSAFRKHLEKIDRETYKRFEEFAKSPEGKKYKVFMTSNQEENIEFLKNTQKEKKEKGKTKETKQNKQQKNNNQTDSGIEK